MTRHCAALQAFEHLEACGYEGAHFAQDETCDNAGQRPSSAGPERQISALKSALRKVPSVGERAAAQRPQTARVASSKDMSAGNPGSHSKLPPWRSSAQESPLHVINDEPIGAFTWLQRFEAEVRAWLTSAGALGSHRRATGKAYVRALHCPASWVYMSLPPNADKRITCESGQTCRHAGNTWAGRQ